MGEILFESNLYLLLLIILGIFLVAIILIGIATAKIWKLHKHLEKATPGIEPLLKELVERVSALEKGLTDTQDRTLDQEKRIKNSIQKVGIVRYKAFEDQGGDQSFSISLLDQKNDGLVISSIAGSEECRVYAKPLINGKSTYPLSSEEEEATRRAIGTNL